jgi:hypothetical protein
MTSFGTRHISVTSSSAPLNSTDSMNTMLISMMVSGGDLSSSRSMWSSEVVGAGVLAFSFTLHSCFVGITGPMSLKCSSLLLDRFFPHLLHPHPLDPPPLARCEAWRTPTRSRSRPRHGVLEAFFCPVSKEIEWSSLGNRTIWFCGRYELVPASIFFSAFTSGTLSCSAATFSKLFSAPGSASPLVEDSLLGPVLP